MGQYGWNSKIGDLLKDERCVAVFKEILPAALESPLLKLVKGKEVLYTEISKYPTVSRDLALLIDSNIEFAAIEAVCRQTEKKLLKSVELFDVYDGDNLPAGKKSYAINLRLQDETKTLADKQIDAIMAKIITNLKNKLGAELR